MHRVKSTSSDAMWSAFKVDGYKKMHVKDYAMAFCPCNARASNEYADCHNLAYMVNVFVNPFIIRWFSDHGINVDEEAYALSQLLQWIFRSAIRNDESINLYLPSSRMRRLLEDWLDE